MATTDPDGKRIARQKADAIAEALELLAGVTRKVEAVGQSDIAATVEALRRDLRRLHGVESAKGGGHLEARKKYKGRSQHLAVEHDRGVITLYLDESGQSQSRLEQPLFVLAGVAMSEIGAREYVRRADQIKKRFGIPTTVSLHGPQIEKGVDDFAFGEDLRRQAAFRRAIKRLVERSDFKLIGAVIRKDVLAHCLTSGEVYVNLPPDLYEMALTFVAERFVDMLHADQQLKPSGRLVFESIGNREDAIHQRALANLLIHGSEFVSDGCFRGWLRPGCEFRSKRGSHPLELADLAARALLTWNRDGRPNDHEFWRLWAPRIASRPEVENGKFGIKIFPDADIRSEVIDLRRQVLATRDEA